MSKIPALTAVRIIPRDSDFLNRISGSHGEVFFDRDTNTLRLYDGQTRGGLTLAKTDLTNITNEVFAAKALAAGISGGGGGNTTVSVGATRPTSAENGNLWLNTNSGALYVFVNDGNSSQWIQPAAAIPSLTSYATISYVEQAILNLPKTEFELSVSADDSTLINIRAGNTIQFRGGENITTSVDENGVVTISSSPAATPFNFGVAADDSTVRVVSSDSTIKFIGSGGVTTASDADGNITITGGGTTGNVTFTGTNIDTTDSSGIVITPAVSLESDLNIDNDLTVNNNIFTSNLNVSGSFTSTGSGTPEIISDNEIVITPGTTTILNGLTTSLKTTEIISPKNGATGVVVHDFSEGALFLHTNLAGNFTVNITNLPTTNNRSTALAFILDQGATAYIPNALQIDGSAQTIKWSGGSVPSGTNNFLDIVNFTLIRSNNAWTVIGSLSTYN